MVAAKNIDTFRHTDIIHSSFLKNRTKRKMINSIIDQIKESEKQAKNIIASSKKESAEIIEKAYQRANDQIHDGELKAKKLLKEAGSRAMEDVMAEKKKIEEEYDKKTKSIIVNSQTREEKAIEILVSKVID